MARPHYRARIPIILGILWAFSGFARAARADPLPIDLSWDAPPECPSQSEVMAELSRITRVKPGRVVTRISAQAKIERSSDGRYELRLRTQREDQTGDTDLDAATCPVLKRGVTLVLALALGDGVDLIDEKTPPSVASETNPAPSPGPAPPPASPAPPQPRPTATTTVAPESLSPTPSARVRGSAWLAAIGARGLVGKPALGPQFGLSARQTHWAALARVDVWPTQSAPNVGGVASTEDAVIASIGGCARAPFGAWSLASCANFELGAIHARSRGAFQDGSATAPWYAAGPSFALTTPLDGPLKLRLEAGLSIAFDPPHFALRSFGDVSVVARFVPALSLGFAFDP
jgi:hypothetical protein